MVWKEVRSLWSASSPFTLVQMHPEHLLHVLETICSGWQKLCWFLYTEHLEDVFQDICHGQALGSLSQWESLCSQGWTAFQISWKCPPTWRGCRIQLEVSKMTSLLYHVGGEDSLQGRQHMFKLKYRIINQTSKGNCEQHKEYVLSPFYNV